MQKFILPYGLLLLLLASCSDETKYVDFQHSKGITETFTQPTVHPSILESSWWQGKSSFAKEIHAMELSAENDPITFDELEQIRMEKISLLRKEANNFRGPKVSPGYPTPNPEGNVLLTTQADVDAFGAMGYKTITGFLEINDTIPSSPICDLSPLSKIKEVGSYLIISATCVSDLNGLSKIKSVGKLGPFGYIAVRCNNVTNINGISGIKTITGSVNVINNFNLTSLGNAFQNITTIESGKTTAPLMSLYVLNMAGNSALTDLGGLGNLTTIERNFLFSGNAALTDLDGFNSLNFIGNFISIFNNASLHNVNKLSVIGPITSALSVTDNPSLTNCCGLYNLICSNPPLCDVPGASFIQIINNGAGCSVADILLNGPC